MFGKKKIILKNNKENMSKKKKQEKKKKLNVSLVSSYGVKIIYLWAVSEYKFRLLSLR